MFSRSNKIAAVVLGIVLTAIPTAYFNSWLRKQGEADVRLTASRTAGLVDMLVDDAASGLSALAREGVDSCRPAHLEAMRRVMYAIPPIKEMELTGPSGEVLCTEAGPLSRAPQVLSSTTLGDVAIEVVRVGDTKERVLRVRRLGRGGKPTLAAVLPTEGLIPRIATDGGKLSGNIRLLIPDGALIGQVGAEPAAAAQQDSFSAWAKSPNYGLAVSVWIPSEASAVADFEDLRRIGMVATGVIALVILITAIIVVRKQRDNPVTEIARAMLRNEFVPYYQPVVDVTSGRLLGAEVLVRWRKPDGSIVLPGAFIPLMESSGLILDLTRHLMTRVCKELGPEIGARPSLSIAFNVAPQHFVDSAILNDVGAIFDGSPIRMSQVVIELTERYQVADLTATRRVVAALQALGCRVAIDDVGTGHNGLSYILKLGVDIIKIDKIFVDALWTERHSQAIIETMVDLARNLHMEIVAEGVENFEQVAYLRGHGISSVQGYVFAPPLPGSSFLELLRAVHSLNEADGAEHGGSAGLALALLPSTKAAAA